MDFNTPQANPKKLFVGNLPWTTTEDELTSAFGQFGDLVSVNIISDRQTGRAKGIAFVEFATEDAAQAAISAMHGTDFNGRDLVVNVARPPMPRENRGYSNNRGGYNGGYNRGGGGYGRNN